MKTPKYPIITATAIILLLSAAFFVPVFFVSTQDASASGERISEQELAELMTAEVCKVDDADLAAEDTSAVEMHTHTLTEVDTSLPIPTVELQLTPAEGGYLLTLNLENFTLDANDVNGDYIANQGHAHLYINGQKLYPIFEETHLISDAFLESGVNLIVVGLNGNDHSDLAVNEQIILAGLSLNTETSESSALSELVYVLDWDTDGINFNADNSWTVTNNLGTPITLHSGTLVSYSAELAACGEASNSIFDWLLPSAAQAGHGGDDPDQSKTTTLIIESLTDAGSTTFDQLFINPASYCATHYLLGPGNLADDSEATLNLTGEYIDSSGQVVPFTISTALAWGQLYNSDDLEFNAEQATAITIQRDLATLFDEIDFETMTEEEMAMQVLRNVVGSVEIQVTEK